MNTDLVFVVKKCPLLDGAHVRKLKESKRRVGSFQCEILGNHKPYNKGEKVILENWQLERFITE